MKTLSNEQLAEIKQTLEENRVLEFEQNAWDWVGALVARLQVREDQLRNLIREGYRAYNAGGDAETLDILLDALETTDPNDELGVWWAR